MTISPEWPKLKRLTYKALMTNNQNSLILLMERYIDTTTSKKYLALVTKSKCKLCDPAIPLLGIYPTEVNVIFTKGHAQECSLQRSSLQPQTGNSPSVHQHVIKFHCYKVQKQIKLTCTDGSQNNGYPQVRTNWGQGMREHAGSVSDLDLNGCYVSLIYVKFLKLYPGTFSVTLQWKDRIPPHYPDALALPCFSSWSL